MWILADGTGRLIAWAITEDKLPPPRPSSVVRELPAWAEPPGPPYAYDPASLDWVVSPKASRVMSRLTFRWRYTLAEQVAIKLAETTHPDATVRATLTILRESLSEANDVDLDDPRTQQGVAFHASVGLIQPNRVAQILGTA